MAALKHRAIYIVHALVFIEFTGYNLNYEKEEFRHWLTESIDRLNVQVDQIESELEGLNSAPKKRKMDKERLERIEELNKFIGQHKYHVKQQERILRMLDNSNMLIYRIHQRSVTSNQKISKARLHEE